MTPMETLRAFVNGEICTDEDCVGCGRISVHSQEGDVKAALDAVEGALRKISSRRLRTGESDELRACHEARVAMQNIARAALGEP